MYENFSLHSDAFSDAIDWRRSLLIILSNSQRLFIIPPNKQMTEKIFGFEKFPKFRLNKPRFPQDTFLGRYLHFWMLLIRGHCLSEKLRSSMELLNNYEAGKIGMVSDQQLWEAQKIKSAILHPDTGEKILPPFRMSGYIPFGWITITGMLLPNPSWLSILFWQWLNQTHNALVNYSNRNATQDQSSSRYINAYCTAVSSAGIVAAGLTSLIKRAEHLDPIKRLIIQRFVPLPATSLASSLNVLCMRWNELESGINVYDSSHHVIGISKIAAKKAVKDTTLTRAFLPIPLLLIPPCVMPFLERRYHWVTKTTKHHIFISGIVCIISFAFSLPISLAIFPQESQISTDRLEPEIRRNTVQKYLFYNRGL
ncbi:Sideroflexin [Dirofilaria immitis]|nr:Sideroflexin [Dirofilaria immitis]